MQLLEQYCAFHLDNMEISGIDFSKSWSLLLSFSLTAIVNMMTGFKFMSKVQFFTAPRYDPNLLHR